LVVGDVTNLKVEVIEEHLGGGDDRVGRIHPDKSCLERESGGRHRDRVSEAVASIDGRFSDHDVEIIFDASVRQDILQRDTPESLQRGGDEGEDRRRGGGEGT
jgi:hypothetical protein